MFMFKSLSVALALAAGSSAFPTFGALLGKDTSTKTSVVEKLQGPPAGWVLDDTAKFDKDVSTIKLRIQLVNQDMDKFHDMAMNVSRSFVGLGNAKPRNTCF
jgi:tripeptidyl-peptidase-1